MYNRSDMRLNRKGLWLVGLATGLAVVGLSAQAPTQAPNVQVPLDRPTFTVQIDLVTTDVIARDTNGNFVPDLTKDEFEVYEDGVKQDIVSMTLSHGGRVTNVLAPPPPAAPEGIILPTARPSTDVTSGRIFVFFVDDLHMQFQNTLQVRDIFKKAAKLLVHDDDLFSLVSSGPSAISVPLTYDKKRLDQAIDKIMGSELKPDEIINAPGPDNGLAELQWRAPRPDGSRLTLPAESDAAGEERG
jgi:VWFA-related protein